MSGVEVAPQPGTDTPHGRRSARQHRHSPAAGTVQFWTGLALFVLCFLPSPGRQVFDTNLVLPNDPAKFLARALHLWDGDTGFGELSDQAYGYLFPMGPFFLVGHALALPAWIVQRAWMGTLLVAAYSGTVRLARALGIGTPVGRIIGAVAYALTPLVVAELGAISAEAIAEALAPWALLPLVQVGRPGGLEPRRAAARSGVAILLMGGTNAFVTLAALPLPAVWLLTRESGRLKRRLIGWWCAAVFAATLWWLIPLAVFALYSPRFILYIEAAANTTGPTSLFDSLRGATDWVSYVPAAGGPWARAGFEVSVRPLLIAATAAVAAAGLAGIAHRGIPHRRFLAAALVVGLALVTFGHVGALTPPWAGQARSLLDGPLAPFRNIHRFDAAFRLCLALGLMHLLRLVPRIIVTGADGPPRSVTRWRAARIVQVAIALTVAVAAGPVFAGRLLPSGSYPAIPAWWRQAAGYLAANAQGQQALLLPASGFGEYTWGRTVDEPFAALASTPWAVRNQAPFAPAGDVLMLDAIEQAVADGRASAGLAGYLERAGVGYLVVRNDLDWRAENTLRPSVVHATLDASPGLKKVAAFGPPGGGPPPGSEPSYDTRLEPAYPAVEIYKVGYGATPVVGYSLAGTLRVSGGPDSVLNLMNAGLLDNATATVLPADPAAPAAGTRPAVTDGLRRQEINFGKPTDHTSATLTPTEPWRLERAANDYDLFPGSGGRTDQTVAGYVGVKDVRASSSGSDITATYLPSLDRLPFAAFHNDAGTYWESANDGRPVGQWIEVDLDRAVSANSISARLLNGEVMGSAVTAIQVSTDSGSVIVKVPYGDSSQSLPLPPGPATHIRLTVAAASGPGLFALTDLDIPGVTAQRTLLAPQVAATPGADDASAVYAFTRSRHAEGCIDLGTSPACSLRLARGGEELDALDRTFTVPAAQDLTLTGTVRAKESLELEAVLQYAAPLKITASSQLVADPRARAAQVADPSATAPWIAGPLDPAPKITFSWSGTRTLSELDLTPASTEVASTPRSVLLVSPNGARRASVPPDGVIHFDALATDTVTVSFPDVRQISAAAPGTDPILLPVGAAKLRFPALDDIAPHPNAGAQLPSRCGDGPSLVIDGSTTISTRVVGTVGDAVGGRALTVQPCDAADQPAGSYRLAAGTHRIRMADSAAYSAETLTLAPAAATPQPAKVREQSVVAWTDADKRVRVGPGDAWLLVMHQNANPGWGAELNGHALRPVTVDGWEQAWLVPAGSGGLIRITYRPDRIYQFGLAIGFLAAFGLLAAAFAPTRRTDPDADNARTLGDSPTAAAVLAGTALLMLAGPAAVIPVAVGYLLTTRAPRAALPAAGAAYALAGIYVAWRTHSGVSNLHVADSTVIATLCLIALGAAAGDLVRKRGGHDV